MQRREEEKARIAARVLLWEEDHLVVCVREWPVFERHYDERTDDKYFTAQYLHPKRDDYEHGHMVRLDLPDGKIKFKFHVAHPSDMFCKSELVKRYGGPFLTAGQLVFGAVMPTADATTDDAISNAPTADTTTRKKTGKQAAAKARKARKQAAAAVSAAVRKQAAEDAAAAAAAARAAEAAGKRPLDHQAAAVDATANDAKPDSTADDDAGLAAAMMGVTLADATTDATTDATPDTDATANATTDATADDATPTPTPDANATTDAEAPVQGPRPKPWFPVLLTRDVKLYGSLVATRENLRKMRSRRAQPGVFAFPRNERH